MQAPSIQSKLDPSRPPLRPRIVLMGCPLDNLSEVEAIDHVFAAVARGEGGWIFTPNLDILRRLTIDPAYAQTTSKASLRLADGAPLIWASRLQGTPLPERVAGSEIIWSLCARAAVDRRSVFFLGGNPGSAAAAAAKLTATNPGLIVAGIECPPLGFERDTAYLLRLEQKLALAAPDLCLVGLPALKQDQLINRLTSVLPKTWFAGIGITFSFVAGEVRKPPTIIRRIGLEWFFRLLQEPRRLARRYLIEGIPFAVRLFCHALIQRFRAPPAVSPDKSRDSACPHAQ